MRFEKALRPVDAVAHHVRIATRIAPGRPALWMGLRMAAAMALPLLLSPWLEPVLATSASLAGYFITLVDKGGAYRTRARAMLIASFGAILAVSVGVLVQGTPLAPPVAIAGFTACAFAHQWGTAGTNIANPAAVLLALACFRPGPAATLPQAVLGTALGAGWAMLLALIVWPVRVHRPGRRALANVLDELAGLADAIADTARERDSRELPLARHRRVRDQLEVARKTMVATRRGRSERDRGELLLGLVQVCDYVFGRLTAVEEALDASTPSDVTAAATHTLHACADILDRLAELVMHEHPSPAALAELDEALQATAPADTGDRQLDVLLAAAAHQLGVARRVIGALVGADEPPAVAVAEDAPARERLRDVLRVDSAVFRHAVRVAVSTTAAIAIASAVHLEFGYWIILTVFLLLQPYRSATTTRTVQRSLGTVVGAIVATALVAVIPQQGILIAITIAFAAVGASVLQLNYALFSLFVTPTFVLLAELQTQDFSLGGIRVAYTLFGAAIAFLASALLWPARERAALDDQLATAIEAAADYLACARDAVASGAPMPLLELGHARRLLGLALSNAELAIDRVIAERAPDELIEARMSAIAAVRRLAGAVNVLGTTRSLVTDADREPVARHARRVEDRLRELANALRSGQPVRETAASSTQLADDRFAPALRLSLHLEALTSAVARAR